MFPVSWHSCGKREFATLAKGNDIGGREQGCGSHDTPLRHVGEGSALVGVAKGEGLDCSRADEMPRLVLRSKDRVLRLR
jgi:hypothetical protein